MNVNNKRPRRVTLKDISARAGVSSATVSKVVNGSARGVSDATRDNILRIIREMNYQPNRLARGLVSQSTKIIALILSDITNPYFGFLARGVEDRAAGAGYQVILCNTDEDPRREAAYTEVMCQYHVDGVIVTGTESEDNSHLDALRDQATPLVSIDRYIDEATYSVFFDNLRGSYIATDHVLRQGHARVAFVGGDLDRQPDQRMNGYLHALADHALKPDPSIIVRGHYQVVSGYEMTGRLLDSSPDVTAVVCGNDLIALGAIKAAHERGMTLPDDLSIVGYDDIELATVIEPNLTTIRQPIYDLGAYAVELLIRLIRQEQVMERVKYFGPELVVRDSVAAPRQTS